MDDTGCRPRNLGLAQSEGFRFEGRASEESRILYSIGAISNSSFLVMASKLALAANDYKQAPTQTDIRHARELPADFRTLWEAREIPLPARSAIARPDLRHLLEYSLIDETEHEVRDLLKD